MEEFQHQLEDSKRREMKSQKAQEGLASQLEVARMDGRELRTKIDSLQLQLKRRRLADLSTEAMSNERALMAEQASIQRIDKRSNK